MISLLVSASILLHTSFAQQTCGPRMSPRLLNAIPCDMGKSSYCAIPGGMYPWSSVIRYIYENQGLMRRMYGDERQSLILKNEIDDFREKYDTVTMNGWLHRPWFSPRSAFVDPLAPPQQVVDSSILKSTPFPHIVSTEAVKTTESSIPDGQVNSTTAAYNATETSLLIETAGADFEGETTTMLTSPAVSATDEDDEKKDDDQPVSEKESQVTAPPKETSSSATVDFETEPIEKKGVNACPVKEEVIAPYWANNTRGETLALLNVYPFEQYVHFEKCSYENTQMFCRDGCRCEQQYRLHRLLAFDPKNECRGIFADWFRFPSCCVCICYDLPDTSIFYRINRRKSRLL